MKKARQNFLKVTFAVFLVAFTALAGFTGCGGSRITDLTVSVNPTATIGFLGQTPDLTGGVLKVTMANGNTRKVDMTDPNVSILGGVLQIEGRYQAVHVSYAGKHTHYTLSAVVEIPEGMHLTFNDEFEGDTINEDIWSFQHGTGSQGPANPWGNRELQFYRAENATVRDGRLIIAGRQETVIFRWLGGGVSEEIYVSPLPLAEIDFANTPALQGIDRSTVRTLRREEPWLSGGLVGGVFAAEYTSSRMRTIDQFYQTFGRFEARMSIPAFPGSWNAFWMMPENNLFPTGGVWPRAGEIDIMENRGSNPRYVGQAVHLALGNPGQHRMLFNQDANQNRLRRCPYNLRGYTTHASYNLVRHPIGTPGGDYTLRLDDTYVFGDKIEYHYHTFRIDWRPDRMTWYNGYYDEFTGEKVWMQVYELTNWRNPSGADGGWTGWWAGAANNIEDVPVNLVPAPGSPGWTTAPGAAAIDPISGLPVASLNTAYLLTRRASAPFDHNFHLILNMAIGGMFDPANNWNIPQGLNVETRIDYVRAWQFDDLVPTSVDVETPLPASRTFTVGQEANLSGGVLRATFPDGSYMFVPMNDARIMRYPRTPQTQGVNQPFELAFRGTRVTVTLPTVYPAV